MRYIIATAALAASFSAPVLATDPATDVTPEVIFGGGNSNGDFTIDQQNGIEVGLRAKVAFQGDTNRTGDTYTFQAGTPDFSSTRAIWNFEYSINTDFDANDGLGGSLINFQYLMQLDIDRGVNSTNFVTFDALLFGGIFGDNSTGNGGGVSTADPTTFGSYLATFNVLQGSQNYGFYTDALNFDPNANGEYTIRLSVFDANTDLSSFVNTTGDPTLPTALASSTIQVSVVPEPATWLMMLTGFAVIGVALKRRKTVATA